jgi:hypothetical protein
MRASPKRLTFSSLTTERCGAPTIKLSASRCWRRWGTSFLAPFTKVATVSLRQAVF